MIGPATSQVLLDVAWILLIVFLTLAAACLCALLGIRAQRRIVARRRERETAAIRADLVAVVVGEEPDAAEAAQQLGALSGQHWDRADELLVGMLPKVRGDAKERVLSVLLTRGAVRRALLQVGSRRSFARCRGAFALGAMEAVEESDHVMRLLSDRSPLVRRVAIRALGMMGDPAAAGPLLDAANEDVGTRRDLTQALVQLGGAAAPALRERVAFAVRARDPADRSGPIAATALGLIGDSMAAYELAEAATRGPTALRLAAAQALGHLDSPLGVPALQAALSSRSAQVQLAAATSLGRLGASSAVPALLNAVERADPVVSRSAASALLALGPRGHAALNETRSPYAVEALAIEALRRPT